MPIGIDGGLVGVITLDLVLAWTSHPIGWLRQLARLLTMGTVAANVSAGWPDPIAVCLYAAAPLMLLVMVEAGRAVLLRRAGLSPGLARDRIPLGRWLLSPWPTFLLWQRMVLWQTTNYRTALDDEARLRRTRTHLRIRFGRHWKRTAPADLVWMLNIAPYAQEAHARVETMIKDADPREAAAQPASADAQTAAGHLEEALRINERHWAQRNRPVSAETLRKQLGVGAATARELTSTVRAMNRSTLENNRSGLPTPPNGQQTELRRN